MGKKIVGKPTRSASNWLIWLTKWSKEFKSTPRMGGTLEHWQYDSFVTRFDDKTIEPAYVTFGLNADGQVERITMKAVSPIADFSYDYQDLLFTPIEASK